MNAFCKRFLSLALALLLTFSLCAGVFADTYDADAVTLDKTSVTLYLREGADFPRELVTATVRPADYVGSVMWSIESSDRTVTLSNTQGQSVSVIGVNPGTATLVASAENASRLSTLTARCHVQVVEDAVQRHYLDASSYTLRPNSSDEVVVPFTLYRSGTTEVVDATFTTDDPAIASVNRSTGLLTGLKEGSTTLRVLFSDGVTVTAPVTVSRSAASGSGTTGGGSYTDYSDYYDDEFQGSLPTPASDDDFVAGAKLGTPLSLHDVFAAMSARFSRLGGNGYRAKLTLPYVGNANYGYLYRNSALTTRVENGYSCDFYDLDEMYFVGNGAGDCIINYALEDSNFILMGTITIRVQVKSTDVSFEVDELENYKFSENTRDDGTPAARLLSSALGTYGSIRFGDVTAGATTGNLYKNNTQSLETLVTSGTVISGGRVGELLFVPSRSGVYRVAYTAYANTDGTGNVLASGAISIGVGDNELNITLNLDSDEVYRFDARTRRNAQSAYELITNAADSAVGRSDWSCIRFDSITSATTRVGLLYESSTAAAPISTGTFVSYSRISDLYFVPLKAGTFEVGYGVYRNANASSLLASGTLRIVVPSGAYGSMDVCYSVVSGGTVDLREEDFQNWFRSRRNSNYDLSHVVFNDFDSDFGTFYYDGNAFIPYNSADYYTSDYAEGSGAKSRLLNRVSYTAPDKTGTQAVRFTAYGASSGSKTLSDVSGVLYFLVTDGEVPDVSYKLDGSASIRLNDQEFSDVYRTAMNSSAASPKFYIQLLGVPSQGTLYYDSGNNGRSTAKLTASNVYNYSFYINGGSGNTRTAVSTLSYSPSGTQQDSVPYIAYSTAGKELYAGRITFRRGVTRTVSANYDGMTFSANDFVTSGSSDVRYITFKAPSEGRLYANFTNGFGAAVTPNTRFYVSNSAEGEYPITSLAYIPRAEGSGSATLDYTVYTRTGSYTDTLRFSLSGKTGSDVFTDVTSRDVGAWAANAIDFAYRWGLIKGTSLTGPLTFSPNMTMQRCDLVLILYRMAGSPRVSGSASYPDVRVTDYYYDSAVWAERNNLMTGVITDGRYDPLGAVTRQDFATILYNYTRSQSGNVSNSGSLSAYQDAGQVSAYATAAMTWAVGNGYITSTSTTTRLLSPRDTATRAQIATLLHRYMTY